MRVTPTVQRRYSGDFASRLDGSHHAGCVETHTLANYL